MLPIPPAPPLSLPPPASLPESDDDPDTLVSRAPDAKGTFADTPLVYILVHALDRRFTGTLTIRHGASAPVLFLLDDGAVVRIDAPDLGDRLGDEALLAGVCSEAQLASALLAATRERTRLGVELVAQAGVRPEMIRHLLLIQSAKRIAHVVNLPPEASYTLHLGRRAREPHEPWAPLDVVLAAVRAWGDRPRIHGTMRFIGARPLKLHADIDLSELVLLPSERTAISAMQNGDCNLESLYRSTGGGLSSLIYVLAVTRQFVFSADKGPPMGRPFAAPAPPLPPPSTGPLATPYELERSPPPVILAMAPLERPITESFGLADTTPGAVIKRTTAPYPIDSPPSGPPARVEAPPNPTPGSPVLSSRTLPSHSPPAPAARPRPSPHPAPPPLNLPPKKAHSPATAPPPAPPRPERVGAGAGDFELAEAALARHDYKAAEKYASKASYADPKNPDYAALFAWVCAHGGGEDDIPEGVRALTRVLEEHPKCESALLYRGMLLRRAGKDKSALRDFVMVLYQNPSHPEALVEVRELRKKKK
jgi:hypothetical protein